VVAAAAAVVVVYTRAHTRVVVVVLCVCVVVVMVVVVCVYVREVGGSPSRRAAARTACTRAVQHLWTCRGHVVDMSWLAWQSRRERKRERGGEREREGKESGGGGVGARIGQHGPEVGGDGESGDEQEGKAKHARPCRQAEPRRQQVRAHNLCTVGRWRDNGFVCAREQGTAARA